VNGSNKKFLKLNYIKNPDIEFKSHEKDEKKEAIKKKKKNVYVKLI
jgi:hypothetical protein